jgi:hypothetical protein
VGTFFSTEFNEPRLDAKAEKGDAGTEFMKLPVSRLQTRMYTQAMPACAQT